LTYRLSIVRFTDGFAWMMQILMFILLGLLVFPEHLLAITWQGLVLSFILMIIARPIGVFLSMIGTKYTGKEKLFISWAGLKGAVPIVLATYPLIAGVEGSELLFNAVFFVVFTSALIQGATLSPLANKLNLAGPDQEQSPHILELVSMGKTSSEIIEVVLKEGSKVIGKELKDVYLPSEVLITAIVRGEQVVTPRGETILENHDTLYVLIPKAKRQEVKKMFQ
jgi:potassium/hydrogen antiporter